MIRPMHVNIFDAPALAAKTPALVALEVCLVERDRLRALNALMLAALRGVISHNGALKKRFQLPESLMRQVREAKGETP